MHRWVLADGSIILLFQLPAVRAHSVLHQFAAKLLKSTSRDRLDDVFVRRLNRLTARFVRVSPMFNVTTLIIQTELYLFLYILMKMNVRRLLLLPRSKSLFSGRLHGELWKMKMLLHFKGSQVRKAAQTVEPEQKRTTQLVIDQRSLHHSDAKYKKIYIF